jgi:hypothetical protein
MLSNSLAAGALATCYLLTLVLQLNPALGLDAGRLLALAQTIGVFYLVHLTVIFYAILVLRQVFASEVFSPAWVSIGVLVWLGAASSAAGATLMWANLQIFALVLEPHTRQEIAGGALALVASAVLFLGVAAVRARLGPPARWRPATC